MHLQHKSKPDPESHSLGLAEAQKPSHMSVFTSNSPSVHNSQQHITLGHVSNGLLIILSINNTRNKTDTHTVSPLSQRE